MLKGAKHTNKDILTISYRSRARLSDPFEDVASIMSSSVSGNGMSGITGLLLYDGTFFMQTIEGPPGRTSDLFARIEEDHRHDGIVKFGVQLLEERDFPEWSMKLLGPNSTAMIVPDMKKFDFTYRRLREIHATAIEMVQRKRVPLLLH